MFGVYNGRKTGVFQDWKTVQSLVTGFPGARFKKFKTMEEAYHYSETGQELGSVQSDSKDLSQIDRGAFHVFTDGAFSSKTKRSGVGIYFCQPFEHLSTAQKMPDSTTNQACELIGIVNALQEIHRNRELQDTVKTHFHGKVFIWSDSEYSIRCLTHYVKKWMKNGWKTASGGAVKNADLIRQGYDILQSHKEVLIELHHISEVGLESHDSRPGDDAEEIRHIVWKGNNRADLLAVNARK